MHCGWSGGAGGHRGPERAGVDEGGLRSDQRC